jgi:hypothetical protein
MKRVYTILGVLVTTDILLALYLGLVGRWSFNSECNVETITNDIPYILYHDGKIGQKVYRERDGVYTRIIGSTIMHYVGETADCTYGSTFDGVGYTEWGNILWYETFYVCNVILSLAIVSYALTLTTLLIGFRRRIHYTTL